MVIVLFPNLKERLRLNLRNLLPELFLILVIVWVISSCEENDLFFLSCTSMMHVFGWIVTLSLCIYTSENLFTFYFLVKEIMLERSLLSSCVMSAFVIVGFSSAIHVLRIPSYAANATTYGDTMYDIFATALGTGEFIAQTTRPEDISDMSHILRTAFAIYLLVAVIIVLNILTSTMIDRYQNAKLTAKNSWRFYAVKSGMHILFTRHLPLSAILCIFRWYRRIISCLCCSYLRCIGYQDNLSLKEKKDPEKKDRLILKLVKKKRQDEDQEGNVANGAWETRPRPAAFKANAETGPP